MGGNTVAGGANISIGTVAGYSITSGVANVAVGFCSMYNTTTGADNIGIGAFTLYVNSTGSENVAIGRGAVRNNTVGNYNTGVGRCAVRQVTTGQSNVGLGSCALVDVTTGSGNAMLGGMTSGNVYSPVFNPTTQNDRVMVGSTATSNAYVNVNWTIVSDARDKIVQGDVPHGLEFVKQLEPKAFHLKKKRDSTNPYGPLRYGFLAQDILALEGDKGVIIDAEDENKLRYHSDYLIPILVNAIKELAADFEAYKASHP
jgi:hypothetical protein